MVVKLAQTELDIELVSVGKEHTGDMRTVCVRKSVHRLGIMSAVAKWRFEHCTERGQDQGPIQQRCLQQRRLDDIPHLNLMNRSCRQREKRPTLFHPKPNEKSREKYPRDLATISRREAKGSASCTTIGGWT